VVLWRTKHDRRSFVEKLDFVTAAGNVDRVVTPLCVMRRIRGCLEVESLHPGVAAEAVSENTGFPIRIPPGCSETPPPTAEELSAIHAFDPGNHRMLDFR
jgi:glutaconate CoA-transferase subunit B